MRQSFTAVSAALFLVFINFFGYAQKTKYVNHTETGVLISKSSSSSVTFQTFNGFRIPGTSLQTGITTGLDIYKEAFVIPLAAGLRMDLLNSGEVGLFAALDAGYGFCVLRKPGETEKGESGIMLNPALGLKFKTKDKPAITLGVGFRNQVLSIVNNQRNLPENGRFRLL